MPSYCIVLGGAASHGYAHAYFAIHSACAIPPPWLRTTHRRMCVPNAQGLCLEGVKVLAAVLSSRSSPPLEHIDLSNNFIGDDGVLALAGMHCAGGERCHWSSANEPCRLVAVLMQRLLSTLLSSPVLRCIAFRTALLLPRSPHTYRPHVPTQWLALSTMGVPLLTSVLCYARAAGIGQRPERARRLRVSVRGCGASRGGDAVRALNAVTKTTQ